MKRYILYETRKIYEYGSYRELVLDSEGEWVEYDEVMKIIAAKDLEIDRLKTQLEKYVRSNIREY